MDSREPANTEQAFYFGSGGFYHANVTILDYMFFHRRKFPD